MSLSQRGTGLSACIKQGYKTSGKTLALGVLYKELLGIKLLLPPALAARDHALTRRGAVRKYDEAHKRFFFFFQNIFSSFVRRSQKRAKWTGAKLLLSSGKHKFITCPPSA